MRSRYMPPWQSEHGYGDFAGELRLTDEQIGLIAKWAQQRAPRGNPAQEPAPPAAANGWLLGSPDLIVKTERPFHLPPDGKDLFWNFTLKAQREQIRAIRIRR